MRQDQTMCILDPNGHGKSIIPVSSFSTFRPSGLITKTTPAALCVNPPQHASYLMKSIMQTMIRITCDRPSNPTIGHSLDVFFVGDWSFEHLVRTPRSFVDDQP
eukprot:TRINITY_DN22502_c0_g1_i1.p1 TRINITY_DN22502_c0_g1~~TRINITY_DN22502_c0_g1_i1.p1  ORF type:complete len:104 (-),score=5.51 TRINITY_DN22502_c0_g1_i1:452-763(-)